jgi:hypothetical protein
MDKRSLKTFIYILDDDSLLNIFHFCPPVMFNEDEIGIDCILEAKEWDSERLSLLCTAKDLWPPKLTPLAVPLVFFVSTRYTRESRERKEDKIRAQWH